MRRLIAATLLLLLLTLIFHILSSSQAIIVPLLVAFSIAYLIISLAEGIRKIRIKGKKPPRLFAFFIAIMLIVGAIYFIGSVLSANISSLVDSAPVYQKKLTELVNWVYKEFNRPVPNISSMLQHYDAGLILTQIAIVLKDIAGGAGIISVYVIFILMEYHYFDRKVLALFKTEKGKASTRKILKKIGKDIQSYLRIKTFLSLLIAVCSYAVMSFVGLDFSEFWAFLIFLLNFIPTLGSIVSTIFPVLLTVLQFESWAPFIIISTGLVSVHFVIGNIIEPKIMERRFNLSGLVIILSLMISGEVWGVIGMLMSVPFLMILNIILSNFPQTHSIAVLLSKTGEIEKGTFLKEPS